MGVSHTRTIYDPNERGYNLKPLAKKYGTNIHDWYIDEKDRMVCFEGTDLLFESDFRRVRNLYKELHELGLKGIERKYNDTTKKWEEEIYTFDKKC